MSGIAFSHENFEKLQEYIYRKTGIFLEKEKHYEKLSKRVEQRCTKLNFDGFRKYFFYLRFNENGADEFQELINALTVNETYFYREKYQFEALVNQVLPKLHGIRPQEDVIRVLSAPCSTGEEPFSIAMHILEEGHIVEERDMEIVGIDIDQNVIKKAQESLYTDRSLHAVPPNIRDTYFTRKMHFWKLSDDLRGAVDFRHANVFDKAQMSELGRFDVIFSRNMLIYFDDASRKEVAMTFYDMLNPGGIIFLGHAEYMSRIVSVFKPVKFGDVLAYQK